jgi:LssY C-terminus
LFEAEYRYSPVSALYFDGRSQDLALQMARASINERIHLRLWRTPMAFQGERIWIGQISRDIGVRFTPKTWNLTTHKIDPDVDEARDYVVDYLMAARRVSRFGYAGGVGAAPSTAPRANLTGDPYFTDGLRAVVVLSKTSARTAYFSWSSAASEKQDERVGADGAP